MRYENEELKNRSTNLEKRLSESKQRYTDVNNELEALKRLNKYNSRQKKKEQMGDKDGDEEEEEDDEGDDEGGDDEDASGSSEGSITPPDLSKSKNKNMNGILYAHKK